VNTPPTLNAHLAGLLLAITLTVGLSGAEFSCTLASAPGAQPVNEAAVSLIPLDRPAPPVAAGAEVEIAQKDQEFSTFLTIIQSGTKVVLPNQDTVQHHVYSLSKPRRFELPLYNPGQSESVVFDLPGLVTIGCNIHDWMISHVVIVPTPWFAKTDAQGQVALSVPAGRYRVEVWHPRMGKTETREITLLESTPAHESFSVTLKPDRRIRRSLGGKAGDYR